MKISIVIPNWNGVYLMGKHLPGVVRASNGAEIIISDDRSTDGSVEYLKEHFPDIVIVERLKHEGFASTVNAGVTRASGDIVVLMNTDVEPESGFLIPLTAHFADPDVFAVGCLEKSLENGKTVLRGRGVARWQKGYYIHSRGEVDKINTAWVSGGSGAFRKSMWKELGGMDTLYNPFYWEDIDLSYRARKAGWKTVFEPKSIVEHFHEQGKIKREFSKKEIHRIAYRNQFIFIWKNVTDTSIFLSHLVWTPVRIAQSFFRGDFNLAGGLLLALGQVEGIMQNRKKNRHIVKVRDSELEVLS